METKAGAKRIMTIDYGCERLFKRFRIEITAKSQTTWNVVYPLSRMHLLQKPHPLLLMSSPDGIRTRVSPDAACRFGFDSLAIQQTFEQRLLLL
jgi:hypothetical protein